MRIGKQYQTVGIRREACRGTVVIVIVMVIVIVIVVVIVVVIVM